MKTLLATAALIATTSTAFAGNIAVLECGVQGDEASIFEVEIHNGVTTIDGDVMENTRIDDRSIFAYTIFKAGNAISGEQSIDIDRFTGEFNALFTNTNKVSPELNYDFTVTGSCVNVERKF